MDEHTANAPAAYPEIHYVTAPMRGAAWKAGDASRVNLWAGEAYPLARELPAADVVREIMREARSAAEATATHLRADPAVDDARAVDPPRAQQRSNSRGAHVVEGPHVADRTTSLTSSLSYSPSSARRDATTPARACAPMSSSGSCRPACAVLAAELQRRA